MYAIAVLATKVSLIGYVHADLGNSGRAALTQFARRFAEYTALALIPPAHYPCRNSRKALVKLTKGSAIPYPRLQQL